MIADIFESNNIDIKINRDKAFTAPKMSKALEISRNALDFPLTLFPASLFPLFPIFSVFRTELFWKREKKNPIRKGEVCF